MDPHNARMLEDACTAAGVELGAYDRRIIAWLAGWEPQTVAVICGLISRARNAATGADPEPGLERDETEQRWLKTRLLRVLPADAEPGDVDDATAAVLAAIPGDTCVIVTGWLRKPRAGGVDLMVLQALRDAIRYQRDKGGPASRGQIGLYQHAARELGINLGPEYTP
jgi:hypothetical protein